MPLENPPIFNDANVPAPGQVLRVAANGEDWEPVTITAAAITVPQTHIAQDGAVSAQTGDAVAAADATETIDAVTLPDATSPANVDYTQADQTALADLVNDLKIEVNAAVVDIGGLVALANESKQEINATVVDVAALVSEVGALRTIVNTLLTELQTASVLSAS